MKNRKNMLFIMVCLCYNAKNGNKFEFYGKRMKNIRKATTDDLPRMMMEDTLESNIQELSDKEKVAETTVYPSYAPSVSSQKSERISETSGKEVYGTVSNGRISIKEKLAQMKEKVSVSKVPKPKDVKRNKSRDCL